MCESDRAFDRNMKGKKFEQDGQIDEAIKCYERSVKDRFDGNFPYDRLAIIYRRLKRFSDEIRVLERAIEVFEAL